MSSPGNACPCGTTGGIPMAQSHRQPTSCGPQQIIAPQGVAGCQLPPPYPQQQRPQVECTCTQNRARNVRPQPMSIQADVVHCSRPPREPCVMEPPPRCNCRENQPPPPPAPCPVVKPCTCTPIQPVPQQQVHNTHVHMPCPQNVQTRGPVPYQRRPPSACAHCRSQGQGGKKKKCVIQ